MPVTKSVERVLRSDRRKQEQNKTIRSLIKTEVKAAKKAAVPGDAEAAKSAVNSAISILDRSAGKNILHANNAARKKSRLMKRLNKALKPAETTETK